MKKAVIVALVCIDVVLLAALVGLNVDRAEAQAFRGANDYLMVTGKIDQDFDAVYLLDMGTRKLGAWKFDKQAKQLRPLKNRALTTDFGK